MNKKTLFILLGIFIVLSIVVSSSWWEPYVNFGKDDFSNVELNFSAFSKDTIEKISIVKSGEEEKNIFKKDGLWIINNFNADERQIDDFFDALTSLKIISLASKNPENYDKLDVTEEKGYILTLTSGNTNLELIIGKQGATFDSFYMKKKESNNVYQVSGTLRNKLSQNVIAWRDKVVVNIPKELIQKVEITSPTDSFTIIKNEDVWNLEKAGKTEALDKTTINRFLAAFNPLEAFSFLNDEEVKEFQKMENKTIIRVFSDNEITVTEIILVKKDNDWWLQTKGKDILYKIPSYKLSNIFSHIDKDIFGTK